MATSASSRGLAFAPEKRARAVLLAASRFCGDRAGYRACITDNEHAMNDLVVLVAVCERHLETLDGDNRLQHVPLVAALERVVDRAKAELTALRPHLANPS